MNDQNIIIISQQPWDTTIGMNSRNMAKEFSQTNRVLFINLPLDLNTLLHSYQQPEVQKRLRVVLGQAEAMEQVEPNIWVYNTGVIFLSANWIASRPLFKAANLLNARMLAYSIQKAAKLLGFDSYYFLQDGLIYPGLELPNLLKPIKYIFNIRDFVLPQPYFKRHGPWLEAELIKRVDVVTANSVYLRDYARQFNPHSHDVGQGCVLSLYQADGPYDMPDDMAAVAHPIIGYTGYLTDLRLDIDLLLYIAQQRPHWNLVLVGPEDEAFEKSALHELPNVYFLGTKTPDQLPSYVHHFDVCINPQIVNDITIGNYPLKIDEYLAMGKPVVATETQAMEMFLPHVAVASTHEEWVTQLETALADKDTAAAKARIRCAQSHTWEATVSKIYDALEPSLQPATP
ncbi:glycosyltransferase [Hymenobacter taeanensis]|uniref:Glycosyltransferase n=1 Tax=Hymenobacter taeanensis TaxID=2735321 RepID=A0A6M6BCL7_9BACT|nr:MULTISPECIES: glycosyltransferase [Hymenobacter]QJX45947.1 glycosyltransferase [Hymenobacter taeanensis]UOQ79794.1 glycosyltransferase [Hymenobacter sp. 5414T-23]